MLGRSALLALLLIASALPAQIGDLDPLVVEILDAEDRRLQGDGLPILFRGKRPISIEQLQGWMRVVAAPEAEENQDRDAPVVMPPSPRYPKAQHPSNRMLVIRCSPHQDAAWVQAHELADVIQGDAHPLLHRGVEHRQILLNSPPLPSS